MTFGDPDLERLYVFARLLRTKLPPRQGGSVIDLSDDVTLTYYRLDRTHEGAIALPVGEPQALTGASDVGTGKPAEQELSPLSNVIDAINKRFGTDFAEGDRLLMTQALNDLAADATLEAQARTNTLDNFRHAFEPAAISAILDRHQRNGEITEQFLENAELRRMMLDAMMLDFYQRAHTQPSGGLSDRRLSGLVAEHSIVSLNTEITTDGKILPKGTRGTVVAVYKDGAAYEVEFFDPFHSVLTVMPEALAR